MPLSTIPAVARFSLGLDSTTNGFGSVTSTGILAHMNPHARENQLQYALRKCNEAIAQTKCERTVLQKLLKQAVVANAFIWFAAVNQSLKDHRIKLNRLTARRSNLGKKLNESRNS